MYSRKVIPFLINAPYSETISIEINPDMTVGQFKRIIAEKHFETLGIQKNNGIALKSLEIPQSTFFHGIVAADDKVKLAQLGTISIKFPENLPAECLNANGLKNKKYSQDELKFKKNV